MLGDWKPKEIEPKWQKKWEEDGAHAFDPASKKPVFSMDTPPPFTSGDLHMGHVLSYAYFDFAARYKRLRGFSVFYPQGWDCQGFPTEVKVESKFGKKLPPEEFRAKCVEWTEEFIARMKGQMVAIGFSPDWRHEYKTMSPAYHRKVQLSLLKMHEDGLVYCGEHPVFWCPYCASAIAKAETEEEERTADLNYLKFETDAVKEGFIAIATTRPELLHACVAVFVNPGDERYAGLVGKTVKVPVYGQKVSILTDADVDPAFGTGIVMMCTFGDKQDVVWTYRHNLPVIQSMDVYGRLLNAGEFSGVKIGEAKSRLVERLKECGLLIKQEKLQQVVKTHDRCKKPIELITSRQWFCKLKGFEESIKKAAREMRWVPEFTLQHLIDWANYIEWDWVISRDRVFGTPLPFWHCRKCGQVVRAKEESLPVYPLKDKPPIAKCACGGELEGEKATCDCWVDSSISPLIVSKWTEDERFHSLTYPATLRPQGTEIIRTWAFYTIYRCLMLTGKPPFKEVLVNGMVLAPDGKKMSKSLGNVIPPDKLIGEYSADAVRQWAALSGAFARDKPFSYKDIKYCKSFILKLWNASKLVEKSLEGFDSARVDAKKLKLRAVDRWMLSRMDELVKQNTANYDNYDYFAIITSMQDFFWHEFCDYYLEEAKHRLYQPEKFGEESRLAAQYTLYAVLLDTLKMLFPILPHASEEIYGEVFASREKTRLLAKSAWPEVAKQGRDEEAVKAALLLNSILSEIRRFKAEKKMALNAEVACVKVSAPEEGLVALVEEEVREAGKAGKVEVCGGEFKVEVVA
ncbi:MAG: valine--tRNA ligase [Candidatus ainarchaeum sp.]|nr:valine--tRNA ligase [Candidatus ainarchaeum sp.]